MPLVKTKYGILLIVLCISAAAGCAAIDDKNIMTYHSGYTATVAASAEALTNVKIPILEEVSDDLRTQFLARRPDGTPVVVEVTRIDQNFTRVSVTAGTGAAHYWNSRVSHQIQGLIREKLSHHSK